MKSKSKVYNKLVRDRIPEIIAEDGAVCRLRKLSKKEFIVELKKKLIEEAKEISSAIGKEERTKELSDIMELIFVLEKEWKIDGGEVEKTRFERREKRGGFDKQLFLISTTGGTYKQQ